MKNQILRKRIFTFLIDITVSSIIGIGFSEFMYSFIIPFLIFGLYYILMDLSPVNGTIGQYFMKLKVVINDGEKINITQSLSIHVGRLISIFTLNYVNEFNIFNAIMFHDNFSNTKLVISN